VTGLPSPLTLLASLTIHGVALSSLFLLATGEPVSSALLIDLSELEVARRDDRTAKERPGPARPIVGAPLAAKPAPSRPASPRARPSSPAPTAEVAPPAAPVAPPSPPLAPREPEVVSPKPEPRAPEPARSSVTAIEEARDGAAPSSPPSAPAEPRSTGGAAGGTDVATDGAAARPQTPIAGNSAGGIGGAVALAPSGPAGLAGEPGAEHDAYLAGIRRRIHESLEYPQAARRRGIKGTVQLEILIKADGAISGVSVAGSSSHPLLDEAALEAVRSLGRQPFPAGLLPRPLRVRLPVVFDLK
jgi:periplasmic protein TonB